MKMNKVIISMITIIVIILGIIAAIFLMKPYTKNNKNIVEIGQTQTSENSITIENNNQILRKWKNLKLSNKRIFRRKLQNSKTASEYESLYNFIDKARTAHK